MRSRPRFSLRGLIVACMIAVAVCPSVVILPLLLELSRDITLRLAIGVLQTTTKAVSDELNHDLQTWWQGVRRIAVLAEQDEGKEQLRLRFDTIVATSNAYTWIGVVDTGGIVTVASAGRLEGQSVGEQRWYQAGISEPFVGDFRDAMVVQGPSASPKREPVHVIDLAVPLRRSDGTTVGVLGAHIDWNAMHDLMRAPRGDGSIELMLLARDGTVLVGPTDLEGTRLALPSAFASNQGISRPGVETWPDGRDYLTTSVSSIRFEKVPSFSWSLIARQPVNIALSDTYAATSLIVPIIGLCGVAIVVASFAFGSWLSRPLARLAAAAEAMVGTGHGAPVPDERLYLEVSVLADSLARLESRIGNVINLPARSTGKGLPS